MHTADSGMTLARDGKIAARRAQCPHPANQVETQLLVDIADGIATADAQPARTIHGRAVERPHRRAAVGARPHRHGSRRASGVLAASGRGFCAGHASRSSRPDGGRSGGRVALRALQPDDVEYGEPVIGGAGIATAAGCQLSRPGRGASQHFATPGEHRRFSRRGAARGRPYTAPGRVRSCGRRTGPLIASCRPRLWTLKSAPCEVAAGPQAIRARSHPRTARRGSLSPDTRCDFTRTARKGWTLPRRKRAPRWPRRRKTSITSAATESLNSWHWYPEHLPAGQRLTFDRTARRSWGSSETSASR